MLFKTVQEMIEWLRKQADLSDQSASNADYHNNNTPWVGQVNPNTHEYVDYETVDYEDGIRLRECADMLDSLNVIVNPIINKVESIIKHPLYDKMLNMEVMCPTCGDLIHPDDGFVVDDHNNPYCSQECFDKDFAKEDNEDTIEESYDMFSDEDSEDCMSNWHTMYFDTLEEARDFCSNVASQHGCANNPSFSCSKGKFAVSYTYD